MYRIDQLSALLEVIGRTRAVLVGGQAVNLWSERYQREAEPWRNLRPFTSVDVYLLGSQLGLDVHRRYHLDFQQALPIELWRSISGPLAEWCRKEAPSWQAEVHQRIRDVEDIARWVQDLKQRPRPER
jgi:hypothetical protein